MFHEAATRGWDEDELRQLARMWAAESGPAEPAGYIEGSPAWGTVRHSSPAYNGQVSPSRLQEVLHAVPSATLIVVAAY
jgi:hypothetical protein